LDALFVTNDRSFVPSETTERRRPTLNPIRNVATDRNAGPQIVRLTGIAPGTTNGDSALTVRAYSSHSALIPEPEVHYTNGSSTALLSFTPAGNSVGSAEITVTVQGLDDEQGGGSNQISRTFTVFILPPLEPRLFIKRSGNVAELSFASSRGISHNVEFKDSFDRVAWTALAKVVGDGTLLRVTDPDASAPQRFYRLHLINWPSLWTTRSGSVTELSFSSVSGSTWVVEYKDALNETLWTELAVLVGNGAVLSVTDPTPIWPQRLYRLRPR
jgi:hypothetical protein